MNRTIARAAATGYAVVYAAAFVYWTVLHGQPAGEVPVLGVIFLVILPGVAWILTARSRPLAPRIDAQSGALPWLAGCLVLASAFVAIGAQRILGLVAANPVGEPLLGWWVVALKLVVFVAVPLLVFGRVLHGSPASFGWHHPIKRMARPRHLVLVVVVCAMYLGLQVVAGQEGSNVLSGAYAPGFLLVAIALSFVWYVVEAGVVEEVFFRAIVQERLAAAARSDLAGLLIGNLVFGLAHAPGLWLRGEFGDQGPVAAAAYSVLVLAPAGMVFGVIWLRTRNLLALILIHGCADAIPFMTDVAGRFGIHPGQ